MKLHNMKLGEQKQNGNMKIKEGKDEMSMTGYVYLVSKAWQLKDVPQFAFVGLYTLLIWNIGARNCSVGGIQYSHLNWSIDAITVTLPVTKCNQSAENVYPKHIYANPYCPSICPFLMLGLHILLCSQLPSNGGLFSGADQPKRFYNWLVTELMKAGSCY